MIHTIKVNFKLTLASSSFSRSASISSSNEASENKSAERSDPARYIKPDLFMHWEKVMPYTDCGYMPAKIVSPQQV